MKPAAPTDNSHDFNVHDKLGWQWVQPTASTQRLVTAMMTVFMQGHNRSIAVAIDLLGIDFGDIVVSNRFTSYNCFPLESRQLCWAHETGDLTVIAERQKASGEFGAGLLHCSSSYLTIGIVQRRNN